MRSIICATLKQYRVEGIFTKEVEVDICRAVLFMRYVNVFTTPQDIYYEARWLPVGCAVRVGQKTTNQLCYIR